MEKQFRICFALFVCMLVAYTPVASRFQRRRFTSSVLTFNTGLLDYFVKREERRDALIPGLKNPGIKSDVVCLQEVYFAEDVQILTKALEKTYPYSFSAWGQVPQCKGPKFESFRQCVEDNCAVFDESTLEGSAAALACSSTLCVGAYAGAGLDTQSCLNCLVQFTPVKALKRCSSNVSSILINPPGLLILSRRKLSRGTVNFFPPVNTPRLFKMGYLQVLVKGLGTVACTHQLGDFGPGYLEGIFLPFGSYENQNLNETISSLNNLDSKRQLVFMGDFNTGPSAEGVEAILPVSFSELAATSRKLTTKNLNQCTLCKSNTFPLPLVEPVDSRVDHIFVRGHRILSLESVLNDNAALSTPDLPLPAIPLSDHYGIRATIRVARCRKLTK